MTTPRFLVTPEALAATSIVLVGGELRHLRVRRLRAGSEVVVCDGRGCERRGVLLTVDRHHAVIRLTAERLPPRESPLRLILAQALLKADKLDEVIEKATELGVSELLLFTSERTLGHCSPTRLGRWARIARGAAKQSQRSTVPLIAGPVTFANLLTCHTDALRLLLWEETGTGTLGTGRQAHTAVASLLVVVGPEGGFTAVEVAQARAAGFQIAGLAPRILRAETAALVAVTLCQFLWGDLGGADS